MKASQRGYSTLELMIVVAVSSVIMYALFFALRTGQENMSTSDLKMTVQDSAREGLYKMLQEIRLSAPLTSPNEITIGAGCTSISFNVPDPNNAFNATTYAINWPGHRITYALNGTTITRSNAATGQTTTIASDVSSNNNNIPAIRFTSDTTPDPSASSTVAPFTCVTGTNPNVVTVFMSVQRTLPNNRVVPNNPLQIFGQARVRNT